MKAEGSITRSLLALAFPAFLHEAMGTLYSFIDSVFLGLLSKEAFSTPIVSWPLLYFLYFIGTGFISGGLAIISQRYGARDIEGASQASGGLLGFTLLLSIALSSTLILLGRSVLTLMSVPESVLDYACTYLRIIALGIPFGLTSVAFTVISSSVGDTRTPMLLTLVATVANVVLDPLLIFGLAGFPALGVKGAAIATVSAGLLVSAIAIAILFRGHRGIALRPSLLAPKRELLSLLLRIGGPLAFVRASNVLASIVLISLVSKFGTVAIAAYGVSLRIVELIQTFTMGVSRATAVMLGQSIGARKVEQALAVVRGALLVLFSYLLACSAVLVLLPEHLVKIFLQEQSVIEEGTSLLSVVGVSLPFLGLYVVLEAVARGSGRTGLYTAVSILRLWLVRIGLGAVLAFPLRLNEYGLWISIATSNVVAGLVSLAWILRRGWLEGIALSRVGGTQKAGLE
uniref:MATE family efflux transporter n=1 Tax=Fervidicoccus fontis TaxID=683846 RepID=A0A7J3ZLN0_9CREN